MCGIAGFLSFENEASEERSLARMTQRITHRGPDGEGTWSDPSAGVYFGHRRLAILDLSPTGKQPMVSQDGKWVISFNGEIYNHLGLRRDLQTAGVSFQGSSDTEVFLEWIARYGLESVLRQSEGMFAFALWNRQDRTLSLARDRFGEKPLYWGWNGPRFFFASELKAIRSHPEFRESLCSESIPLFLQLSYIPAPLTIAEGIFKLLPGEALTLKKTTSGEKPHLWQYWNSLEEIGKVAANRPAQKTSGALVEKLDTALKESILSQMQSDVPVGAFLSGGIDSSLVVSLMQEASGEKAHTFTVGFDESDFNEAPYAREIAKTLGTIHHETVFTGADAQRLVPKMGEVFDEPFADPSQLPTYFLSQMASQFVKVCLSGDAGDELFGGYPRHFFGNKLDRIQKWLPEAARIRLADYLLSVPEARWDQRAAQIKKFLGRPKGSPNVGNRVRRLGETLRGTDSKQLYFSLATQFSTSELNAYPPFQRFSMNQPAFPISLSLAERIMAIDTIAYLPNDVLTKVDRASMASGLEVRAPFLNSKVFDLAWQLRLNEKMDSQQTKLPLQKLLQKRLSPKLFERPKKGFSIPLQTWLRGPLEGWASELIQGMRADDWGLKDTHQPEKLWLEHNKGERDHSGRLWSLLMLQSWKLHRATER